MDHHLPDKPFRAHDARRLGISKHTLKRAVREGRVTQLLRGVYLRSDLPVTPDVRAAAAALVITPGAVIRDRFAAWLHGIDLFNGFEAEVVPPIETCVLRGRATTRRQGVDGRTRDLQDQDVMTVGGVRVTTPLRTVLDLGCNLWRRDALHVLDVYLRRFGTREDLRRGAVRYYRRRGVVQLRELIPLADGRSESRRESWTRLEIHDANLPAPEPQYWIEVDGFPRYRLDLAYPKHRVAVEYDGEDFHHRTDERKERDRERRKWLRDHGWTVIVVQKGDFTGAALDRWLGGLACALEPPVRSMRF